MNIFVTGATGFLGGYLVRNLVKDGHNVYALVRNQKKFEALISKQAPEHREKIFAIEGELLKDDLRIDCTILQSLVGKIDAVYHSAAILSFDENAREISFEMNFEGTKRVLQFAEKVQAKIFIHVSTAYTLGDRTNGVEALYPIDSTFINSYEESKCHAEHLVMTHMDRFDVMIMRPAIIVGHSETGEADTTFGMYGVLRTIMLLKKKAARGKMSEELHFRLLMDEDTLSNIVPVDYVAKVLTLGLTYGEKNTIYNITNSNPPSNAFVLKIIKEVLDFQGIELIPYTRKEELSDFERKLNDPLEVFKDYLNRSITFSDTNTRELLERAGDNTLNMDKEMLERIISGYSN